MVYSEIRKKLPFSLTFLSQSSIPPFQDPHNSYDVAIGGIPFNLAIDANNPLMRSTAQFKKDQLDTSDEPGEQSLTGWWIRSQSSFHLGSGLKYGDPQLDPSATFRYDQSEGVDVWTLGQVSLLPTTAKVHSATGNVKMVTGIFSGTEVYYRVDGNNVIRGTSAGTETTISTGASPVLAITTDGSDVYFADTSTIKKSAGGSTTLTTEWNLSSATSVTLGWVKQRMIAAVDNKVYVPTFGSSTLPGPVYSHPNASWVWSDISEGPEAIYVSGSVGNRSSVIKLGLDNQGAVPTLTNATVVAEMPTGETVRAMRSYLGTYLGIGTSKGVRIATFQQGGAIAVGPLIQTPSPVKCLAARGDHFLAGFTNGFSNGQSGLLRVSLAATLDDGRNPYAPDLQVHAIGSVDSVAVLSTSDKIVIGVMDQGIYLEDDDLEVSGFLQTSRQRFNTVWPKLFKRFNARGDFFGAMSVSTIDDTGTETSILSISGSIDQTQDFAINYPDTPQEFLALKFTLHVSDDDPSIGTVFRSYQLKALPGGPRPRQIVLPLLCFDYERDARETLSGTTGWAWDRIQAIEALDSAGDVVQFQDLKAETATLCTIEGIEFRQTQSQGINGSRFGGILTIILRTLSL
jgi:hypothetical protein